MAFHTTLQSDDDCSECSRARIKLQQEGSTWRLLIIPGHLHLLGFEEAPGWPPASAAFAIGDVVQLRSFGAHVLDLVRPAPKPEDDQVRAAKERPGCGVGRFGGETLGERFNKVESQIAATQAQEERAATIESLRADATRLSGELCAALAKADEAEKARAMRAVMEAACQELRAEFAENGFHCEHMDAASLIRSVTRDLSEWLRRSREWAKEHAWKASAGAPMDSVEREVAAAEGREKPADLASDGLRFAGLLYATADARLLTADTVEELKRLAHEHGWSKWELPPCCVRRVHEAHRAEASGAERYEHGDEIKCSVYHTLTADRLQPRHWMPYLDEIPKK
jgi:hypothetical protein